MGGTRRRGRQPVRTGWRAVVDSFGGFLVVGSIGAAIVVVVALVVLNRPGDQGARTASTQPLMGELINTPERTHVADQSLLRIVSGQPPAGGPHFATAQAVGTYDTPIPDGNAIHALEHGIVWISYNPDKVDAGAVTALKRVAQAYPRDAILSPRPDNSMPIALASWMRLLRQDTLDEQQMRDFIVTNRNRSPEPFAR